MGITSHQEPEDRATPLLPAGTPDRGGSRLREVRAPAPRARGTRPEGPGGPAGGAGWGLASPPQRSAPGDEREGRPALWRRSLGVCTGDGETRGCLQKGTQPSPTLAGSAPTDPAPSLVLASLPLPRPRRVWQTRRPANLPRNRAAVDTRGPGPTRGSFPQKRPGGRTARGSPDSRFAGVFRRGRAPGRAWDTARDTRICQMTLCPSPDVGPSAAEPPGSE